MGSACPIEELLSRSILVLALSFVWQIQYPTDLCPISMRGVNESVILPLHCWVKALWYVRLGVKVPKRLLVNIIHYVTLFSTSDHTSTHRICLYFLDRLLSAI
jgi:hypothetical protein